VTVAEVRGGRAAVDLATGDRIELPAGDWGARAGGRAVVMVRPERLRLDAAAAARGMLAAVVGSVAFQGPVMRCDLRARDGTALVARLGPEQAVPGLRPGQELRVSWDVDAARLLPPVQSGDAGS